jgi:hypothetical protein
MYFDRKARFHDRFPHQQRIRKIVFHQQEQH